MEIVNVQDISPHNKAVYESGKKMLVDSITVGADFCKTMITISTGSIPTYLALIKFVQPEKYVLNFTQISLIGFTAILFLSATISFAVGFLPTVSSFSLENLDEIELNRAKVIKKRALKIKLGMLFYILGVLFSIFTYLNIFLSLSSRS